ncbi:hypothetical protein GON01_07975 [Sphingomonas sp. MAH-20]|uniref:Uncharacterized protein n=1 Tax=Sphingomonas horti TaxID=2682842 RepID=A0A6I4J008_9SPHN|nr:MULTISPECIES: hypothetical protein [Sphingomonas]MBA2919989.1 hypothetical protein [Sphingomonas sp. CGMCC 1.13658]MVO77870.1 hypothetical protein [Sphingomonas horti]
MRNWASRRLLGGAALAAALAAVAIPALGQDQAPESLLPPGFGDTPVTPTPPPAGQPAPQPGATPAAPGAELPLTAEDQQATGEEELPADETETAEASPFDLPEAARRDPNLVGVLTPDNGGYDADQWGNVDGRFASTLMRDIKAPVASRWAQILLRRVLLTRAPAPAGIDGADWVAERAWLLLRMGEADPARMLVAGVDVDRFTPKMFDVAQQTALATADPAAMCPLTDHVPASADQTSWDLVRAMCAALSGDNGTAGAIVDAARHRGRARGIDLLLAEKVVGVGGARRAINIEWTGVDNLTAWRFGLANAVNVPIPAALFDTVGPHVEAWQYRAPMISSDQRLVPASWAASLGVLSNAAYVDLIGRAYEDADPDTIEDTAGFRLRNAYSADDPADRIEALRTLWSQPKTDMEKYARLVLTARAAARVAPGEDYADDARNLIASLFTAGLDDAASKWGAVADQLDDGDDGWALLAVGAPKRVVTISAGRAGDYVDQQNEGSRKGAFLVAALAGLGRITPQEAQTLATDHQLPLGLQNSWTRAIDRAAARNQPATVALLAAAGMQTLSWKAVHPAYLMHIVSALRRVGHEPEARMIAAEAITRA